MEINFNFTLFFIAFGLACCLESLPWLLSPRAIREALSYLLEQNDDILRMYGAALLLFGLFIMFISFKFII